MFRSMKIRRAEYRDNEVRMRLRDALRGHSSWQEEHESPEAIQYEADAKRALEQCYHILCEAEFSKYLCFDGPHDIRLHVYIMDLTEMLIAVHRGIWSDACNALGKIVRFQKITQPEVYSSLVFLLYRVFGLYK